MSDHDARLLELIARMEAMIAEMRGCLDPTAAEAAISDERRQDEKAVRAFADETFRARDA